MNTHVSIPAAPEAAPIFPERYLLILDAPGGAGDGYEDGDQLLINTLIPPDQGDLVCVHPRRGGSFMAILDTALPDFLWRAMPFREQAGSTAHALIIGHILGTERGVSIKLQDCWAIHYCEGKHEIGGDA